MNLFASLLAQFATEACNQIVAAPESPLQISVENNPVMSAIGFKTRSHDHASHHAVRTMLIALVSFCVYGTVLAKTDTPSKNSMDGTTQTPLASKSDEPTLYTDVSAYVESTLKKLPTGYQCVISPNNSDIKQCTGFSAARSENINRTFGIFYKASDLSESGFLFIIEKHRENISVMESQPFQADASAMRYGWGVENFVADSNESFHFQATSGSASMPDSDIFRFKLVEGEWILSGHDHKTLSGCTDGSIGNGNSYSINFLTKNTLIEFRNDCKRVKTIERPLATHPIPWASFTPSDPLLDPEAYGVAWY
ncbi:hypothetical protein [Dyella flagellata]|uniref:hypothetical protein n=1 Tax=Dyella flagellata TaxID=1867833 RepID=UPI0024E11889|nr:hypothetical protein [Dyella flagellata]